MSKRLSQEEFISRINCIRPDVIALEPYIKNNVKIKFQCKTCGHIWSTDPQNIFAGSGCPVCGRKKCSENRKIPLEDVLIAFANKNIQMIGKYRGVSRKVLCRCDICGHQWETYPNLIMNNVGCPACAAKKNGDLYRKSTERFIQEMNGINSDLEIVGEYYNSNTHIECRCKICNNNFFALPSNLIKGKGCGHCTKSKGEKKIRQYCENNHIMFIPQKTYNNLLGIGGRQLSYDFYLPEYNLLIEYQGEYHDGTANNQTEEGFLIQQEHDKRKSEYATVHNIQMLEIWYYEFNNIENILKRVIDNTK
jgi:predicted  nucleic acid-binding Zn-ribbon protein